MSTEIVLSVLLGQEYISFDVQIYTNSAVCAYMTVYAFTRNRFFTVHIPRTGRTSATKDKSRTEA